MAALPVQSLTPESTPEEVKAALMATIEALMAEGMSQEEATQKAYELAKAAMSAQPQQPKGRSLTAPAGMPQGPTSPMQNMMGA